VVWAENRERDTLFDLYGSFTEDGVRFRASQRLNDDQEPAFNVWPAVTGDGRVVHVLSQDYREIDRFGFHDPNIHHTRMAVREDDDVPDVRVNDVPDGPQSSPAIARDPTTGRLLGVWFDARHRLVGDLYASASADGGRTWSRNRRVNANDAPEILSRPDIVPRRAGGFWVVWLQIVGGISRTSLRRIAVGTPDVPSEKDAAISPRLAGPRIEPLPRTPVAEENFDDGSLASWTTLTESWIAHDGALLGFGNTLALASWEVAVPEDFVLEGRFHFDPREHLSAHVFVRVAPDAGVPGTFEGYHLRNHFRMGVFLSESRIEIPADRPHAYHPSPLGDRWLPIRQEGWHAFRLVVAGSQLDYWLDGEWVLSHEGLEPRRGKIVLGADARAPVLWDDLRLYSLDTSQRAMSP
jgi:hypothetical protein